MVFLEINIVINFKNYKDVLVFVLIIFFLYKRDGIVE